MSGAEFERWIQFYNRFPFDDAHRYHRPALAHAMMNEGLTVQESLEWLEDGLPKAAHDVTPEEADANTLRAFGLSRPKGK